MSDEQDTQIPGNYADVVGQSERRIKACLVACMGMPTEALEAGAVAKLVEACKAVNMDAAGRSGGSVYLIHKKQFLQLLVALVQLRPEDWFNMRSHREPIKWPSPS